MRITGPRAPMSSSGRGGRPLPWATVFQLLATAPFAIHRHIAVQRTPRTSAADFGNRHPAPEGDRRAAEEETARIERPIEKLDTRSEQLHTLLADAANVSTRPLDLDAELRGLIAGREELEEAWPGASVL